MKKIIPLILAVMLIVSICYFKRPLESVNIEYCGEEVQDIIFNLNENYSEEELTLKAITTPDKFRHKIIWESSNELVASIRDSKKGNCILELKDAGSVKINALCGDFHATVRVTVNRISAENYIPCLESFEEGYTFEPSANEAGLPFTPNDVIASGLISDATKLENYLLTHREAIATGNVEDAFVFGNSIIAYEMKDKKFKSFTTVVDGNEVNYNFNYNGNSITGFTADFGNGRITEMTVDTDNKGDIIDVVLTGYGGEQHKNNYYSYGVNEHDGGFRLTSSNSRIDVDLGCYEGGNTLQIFLDKNDSGTGVHIYSFTVMGNKDGSGVRCAINSDYNDKDQFSIDSNEKSQNFSYYTNINGNDCEIKFLSYEGYSLSGRNLKQDEYSFRFDTEGFSEGYIKYSDSKKLSIDADGNITDPSWVPPAIFEVLSIENAKPGYLINFGSYEQDGDFANGAEPIEWIVLARQDNRLFVISRYGLELKPYNDSFSAMSWGECSLRQWLNSGFCDTAFSKEEMAMVQLTKVETDGNVSEDKIYIISDKEFEYYLPFGEARLCIPTAYAEKQANDIMFCKFEMSGSKRVGAWWLRTPGSHDGMVKFINTNGTVDWSEDAIDALYYLIRPVMVINLDS